MYTIIYGDEKVLSYIKNARNDDNRATAEVADSCKPSCFNYAQKAGKDVLVYNTLTNSLIRMSELEYKKLLGEKPMGKKLRQEFLSHGLLVDADFNERKALEAWASTQRIRNRSYLSLNITTTMKCNARCPYCYEKGVRQADYPKTGYLKLLSFIKKKVNKDDTLVINWFGGEPLLNKELIDYISDALKKIDCKYSSYLITNGSLLNKTLITRKFRKWKVKDVQITLDGMKDTYEHLKNYKTKKKDIFEKILENIKNLADRKIRVHIRLNTDRENMDEILALIDLLEDRFGNLEEVTYYPAFLTGVGLDLSEQEKIHFIKSIFAKKYDPKHMNMGKRFFSSPKYLPCMRNDPRSLSIDIHGNVYKCEHYVGQKEHAFTNIRKFDSKANTQRCQVQLSKECRECVFLPKCMGGCKANQDSGDEPCMIEKYLIQGYLANMADL